MKISAEVKVGDILTREIDPPQKYMTKVTQEVRVIAVSEKSITVDTTESDEEKKQAIMLGAPMMGEFLHPDEVDISGLIWDYDRETGEIIEPTGITSRII